MRVAIVGSETAKFNDTTRRLAKSKIKELLSRPGVTEVVSGGCHLGGIDIWAAEVGRDLGLKVTVFKPKQHCWTYYKKRNIKIAENCDECHCITVEEYPDGYDGMRFRYCYHCQTDTHIKSGGCWTVNKAISLGVKGYWHVIKEL